MMFEDIGWKCCRGVGEDCCVCSPTEMVMRQVVAGEDVRPFTNEERVNLINDANYCGEGYYSYAELNEMSDFDLSRAVLNAWSMYTQAMR